MSFALLLTIALGVGSNAAIYGFLQGLIHPASPVRGADRLVSIFLQDRSRNAGPLSADEYRRFKDSRGVFDWVGAARIEPRSAVVDKHTEITTVAAVTPELAETLSLPLSNGVVISHRMWHSEFEGKASVLGSRIRVDDQEFRIEGVAPEKLDGLYSDQTVDLWISMAPQALEVAGTRRDLWLVARLRESVTIHQAQADIGSFSKGLGEITILPFTGLEPNMARGLSHVGLFLTFSAAALFLIACINVASFLLGRALRRSHETCLRVALGATRVELFQDLLADSIVISAAGGALGVLLGVLTARALPSFLFEGDAERLSFAPHLLPIFMAALVCVSVVVICGMMPMAGTVTDRPWMVLQRETGSPSRAILRLRSALVVAQITACCMLVVCTVVLRAGLDSALETGAGKRLENPVLLTVQALPLLGPEIEAGYFEEVAKKMTMLNGMRPLAWTARLPGNQPNWRNFRIQQPSLQFRDVSMDISWLTPESVQSLDRQPVAGKVFGVNDQRYKAVVVNEEAAAALFGNQTVGMVIRDASDLPIEIVGIVKKAATQSTVRSKSSTSAGQKSRTIYYGYLNQAEAPNTIRNADFRVPVGPPEANIELNANVVSGNYFSALGMPLVAGQRFSDARIPGEGRVAVINQEAADLYFNGNAVGSGVIDDTGLRTEIIGVAKSQTFGTFEQHAEPTIYFPLSQDCPARMTLLMKASKWNSGMAAGLRQKVQEVPGGSSGLIGVTTLNDQLAQSSLAPLRIAMLIGAVSAGMALILGILGLLNTQTDAERQRQRDRAVRIALGAQRWRIVLLVMNTAGRLALCGAMIGVLLSFATIRILIADVATVSPSLQVWLIAPLLPVAAVIAASLIPARRASVVAPARIMRDI